MSCNNPQASERPSRHRQVPNYPHSEFQRAPPTEISTRKTRKRKCLITPRISYARGCPLFSACSSPSAACNRFLGNITRLLNLGSGSGRFLCCAVFVALCSRLFVIVVNHNPFIWEYISTISHCLHISYYYYSSLYILFLSCV